jgi:hypothetical protein
MPKLLKRQIDLLCEDIELLKSQKKN